VQRELAERVKAAGLTSIEQAVGIDAENAGPVASAAMR
jgi:hypothetical protein